MLPFLFTILFTFAHAEDNKPASFTLQETYIQNEDYGFGLQVTSQGRLHLRPLHGSQPRRGDNVLLARLGEHDLPELEFRNVLTLDNRVFGTLVDGRVVEIGIAVSRHRTLTRYWVHRLTSGGLGAGGSLLTAGLAGGHGAMAAAGGLIAVVAGALPLVTPTLGFELYLDYGVVLVGGEFPFVTQDVVQANGRIVDLMMARGKEETSLAAYLKRACGGYLIEGTFERSIQ